MPSDYESLRAKTQKSLVGFLNAELASGRIFVQSAQIAEGEGHVDDCTRAKRNSIEAAESVRGMMDQVTDDQIRMEIRNQLAELDRLISML